MTPKDKQKQHDTAERLKDFVLRSCGRLSPEEMQAATGASLYLIKMLLPNPAR